MVRLQVSCGVCNISWRAGIQQGEAVEGGLWAKTVGVYVQDGETTVARISASPTPDERGISWVRISVDGKVVVEKKQEVPTHRDPGSLRALTVETPVPPPTGGS